MEKSEAQEGKLCKLGTLFPPPRVPFDWRVHEYFHQCAILPVQQGSGREMKSVLKSRLRAEKRMESRIKAKRDQRDTLSPRRV